MNSFKVSLLFPFLSLSLSFLVPNTVSGETEILKTAVIVANNGGAELDSEVDDFQSYLSGEITQLGYGLISPENVLYALDDLQSSVGSNSVDSKLKDRTSALNLARNLGADLLLVGNLISYDKETREVNAYDAQFTNIIYTLRANYQIIDGSSGSTIASGNVSPSRTFQQTKHSNTTTNGLLQTLLQKAAKNISAQLKSQTDVVRKRVVDATPDYGKVNVTVQLNDIQIPEVAIGQDGKPSVVKNTTQFVEALNVIVEVDGIAVGTTGTGALEVPLGLHRLSLTRDGLKTWERTVNLRDGMDLNITMDLTDVARSELIEDTQALQDLKNNAQLTDADAEVVRATAEMLQQSGYKVDIKVDTEDAPTINNNSSLLQSN